MSRKRWRSYDDEHAVTIGQRAFGFLGPVSSCFTLAWLASHRKRLHSFFIGGKRLSIFVVWDSQGSRPVESDDGQIDAIRRLTYGPDDIRGQTSSPLAGHAKSAT